MVNRRYLFIEGAKETANGELRVGFSKLLVQKLRNNMPRISMGEGKTQTIKKIINSDGSFILCDLDKPSNEVESDLTFYNLLVFKESVFYMVQEMEAWFISQPEILDKFYNCTISSKLAKKHGSEFSEPDVELQRITKETKKGTYHKVHHGLQLLQLLDASKLENDFPDFKRLIEKLR